MSDDSSEEADAWMDAPFKQSKLQAGWDVTGCKQPLTCSAWERGYKILSETG